MGDPAQDPSAPLPPPEPPPVRERRRILGASAVLLPVRADGSADLGAFEAHLERTVEAGLVPAVNMDTGFGPFLSPVERAEILALTSARTDHFIAGVHTDPVDGAGWTPSVTVDAAVEVRAAGGLPILFPFEAMSSLDDRSLLELHEQVADAVERVLAFELGPMFHPAGRIFSAGLFEALLGVEGVVGAKHSSLRRDVEWSRIRTRDRVRPDFVQMTGNDLAIDLVVHGCDYLLGLSTFAPDAFALRDHAWEMGDQASFYELDDVLQYLGRFAFRAPVPAYRHDAAMFLALRGWLDDDRTHPRSPSRPDADRQVLALVAEELDDVVSRCRSRLAAGR